jgi:hypothetical protein
MATLNGSPTPVSLGDGYALRAPGVRGTAEMRRPQAAGLRTRGGEDASSALAEAFAATEVTTVRDIELRLQPAVRGPEPRLRSAAGGDAVELQVPDPGPDARQLVLSCDESGVLSWHLPIETPAAGAAANLRGPSSATRFIIPATPLPASPEDATRDRSLVSAVGRKLLKVLVYPVTDPIVGKIGELFAERWEARNRPYGVRDFNPDSAFSPNGRSLAAGDWERLGKGRALLFIHGTFSTAHGAFNQLPMVQLERLAKAYEGRLLAFNHYTLSHDPVANVRWLLAQVPSHAALQLDIICHSRGGLVARTLAERPAAFDLGAPNVVVRRVVFAGVPNQGTLLAHPDHMVNMIDRLTTVLNLFPTGVITETLEAMITALKVIGHGALQGLPGLTSMRPEGEFLSTLNQGRPDGIEYFGISANFEPPNAGLKALVRGTADAVLDFVFQQAENDLVVPEAGVYAANGSAAFPIGSTQLLRLPQSAAISHTTMFGYPQVSEEFVRWLEA